MSKIKLAVLDMYDGEPNQGMRAIGEILNNFKEELDIEIFDVRGKCQLPDLSFDIYLSTGGPGNPLEGDGVWDARWQHLMDDLWHFNLRSQQTKKHVFFICHSFQMICDHFSIGEITKRKKKSFGTFPVYKTPHGKSEWLFKDLGNPFWIADFREYQVVQPNYEVLEAIGAEILLLEKIRPHVPYERAIMAVRLSAEFIGTQFHPEADPLGMREHFMKKERREAIFEEFGKHKYFQMLEDLDAPDKIPMTHQIILPRFLRYSIASVKKARAHQAVEA